MFLGFGPHFELQQQYSEHKEKFKVRVKIDPVSSGMSDLSSSGCCTTRETTRQFNSCSEIIDEVFHKKIDAIIPNFIVVGFAA